MKFNLKSRNKLISSNIETITEASKQLVMQIIQANSKNISLSIEKNKLVIDGIRDKVIEKNMDPKITDSVYKSLVNSVLLAEEMIDAAIDDHNSNIKLITESYLRLIESFDQQIFGDENESMNMFNLYTQHFETSVQMANNALKNQVNQYNKHANFALNFNRNFSENINNQLDFLHEFKNNTIFNNINNWVSEWNKQTILEKVEYN